ncbi:MAG TPA: plastocyanin/azurin family copper-binding protein [Gemmatimonadaceae bacterium]
MRRIRAIVPALCALSIAACGGGGSGGSYSTGPTGNTPTNPVNNNPVTTSAVTLTTDSFSPGNINVATGTTVTWTWNSCTTPSDGYGGYGTTTCVAHTVLFDDGVTSSSQSSGTFTRQFATAGTYKYHCAIHGTAMSGQVVVQ